MKKIFCSLLFLAVSALLIVSCKQSNKTGAMIPNDAAVVIHLNANSLNSKLSWDEIKQTNWFKETYADAPDSLAKKLMDDPANSGMDIKSDFIFFLKNQGSNGYMVFEGFVKDAATFEAFNKKVSNDAATTRDGEFSNMKLPGGAVVTWNKERFVYVIDAPYMNMGKRFSMEGGNSTEPSTLSADTLMKISKSLFSLKSDNSLGGNEKFGDMIKEEGDLHMWMNSEYMYNGFGDGMLSMMKVNTLIQGNVSATTINFDNGRIVMKSKGYYNKELAKIFDKYPAKEIGSDIVNRIPSQNVVAAFVMNYPPEGLKEFMKVIGVDGMVNGFLGKANYSIEEFIKANKGEILIAVTDFAVNNRTDTIHVPNGEPMTHNQSGPEAKVLFATSINDKAAFDKLIGTVKAQGGEDIARGMPEITYNLNNNWFAVSNSADHVTKFLAGGSNNHAFASKISGHPFGGYIDIQKIMKSTGSAVKDSSEMIAFNASLQMWQDIVITGGEYKNGALSGEFEVNLVNKNTNSLKQLNMYFDQLSKTIKAKQKKYEEYRMDSLPPAVEVPTTEN
ncbi:MAG: DUF4836 family protein [Chitinophagaceae bacterium]|nr:DUF4836 family protein [Chitinophagaceae bacterium]